MKLNIIPIGSSDFTKRVVFSIQNLNEVIDNEKFTLTIKKPTASYLRLKEHYLNNAPAQFFPPQQLQSPYMDQFSLKDLNLRVPLILLQEKGDWSITSLERALLHEFGHAKCGSKVWSDLKSLMYIVQGHYTHDFEVFRVIGSFIDIVNWDKPRSYQPKVMLSEVYAYRYMFERTDEQKEAITHWRMVIQQNQENIVKTKSFLNMVIGLFSVLTLEHISQIELSDGFFSTMSQDVKSFSEEMSLCAYESRWKRFFELFILVHGKNYGITNIENLVDIVSKCTKTMDDDLQHYYPFETELE